MSVTKTIMVWCDGAGCERWVGLGEDCTGGARAAALEEGWAVGQGEDGVDLCPDCKKRVARAQAMGVSE